MLCMSNLPEAAADDTFISWHAIYTPYGYGYTEKVELSPCNTEKVRCVGVRGDAWSVMLSPCNTEKATD